MGTPAPCAWPSVRMALLDMLRCCYTGTWRLSRHGAKGIHAACDKCTYAVRLTYRRTCIVDEIAVPNRKVTGLTNTVHVDSSSRTGIWKVWPVRMVVQKETVVDENIT